MGIEAVKPPRKGFVKKLSKSIGRVQTKRKSHHDAFHSNPLGSKYTRDALASGCYSVSTVNKMGNKLRPNIGSSPAMR